MIAFVCCLFGLCVCRPGYGYAIGEYRPNVKGLDLLDILIPLIDLPYDDYANDIMEGVRLGRNVGATGSVSIVGQSGYGFEPKLPCLLQPGPYLPPVVIPYIIPAPSPAYPSVSVPATTIPCDRCTEGIQFSGIVPASGKVIITGTFGGGFRSFSSNPKMPGVSAIPFIPVDRSYYDFPEYDYYFDNGYDRLNVPFSGIVPSAGQVAITGYFNNYVPMNHYAPYSNAVRGYDNLYKAHLLHNEYKKNREAIPLNYGRNFEGLVPARGKVRLAAKF